MKLDAVAEYITETQAVTYRVIERMALNIFRLDDAFKEAREHHERIAHTREVLDRLSRRNEISG